MACLIKQSGSCSQICADLTCIILRRLLGHRDFLQRLCTTLWYVISNSKVVKSSRLSRLSSRQAVKSSRRHVVKPSNRQTVKPSNRQVVKPSSRQVVKSSARQVVEPSSRPVVSPSNRQAVTQQILEIVKLPIALWTYQLVKRLICKIIIPPSYQILGTSTTTTIPQVFRRAEI